jgi:lysophospholipase L1-like esterase
MAQETTPPPVSLAGRVSRRLALLGDRVWTPRAPDIALNAWGAARLPAPVDRLLTEAWLLAAERAGEALTSGDRLVVGRLARATEGGATPYAVVGDSHSRILVRRHRRQGAWLLPVHRLFTGASARGLGVTGSRSGAGERMRRDVEALLAFAPRILLMFGQIDIEFVHPYRRFEARRLAFDPVEMATFVDETVERYAKVLAELVAPADRARIDLVSILPPALSDAAWRDGYRNAHIAALHGPADSRIELDGLERPAAPVRAQVHAAFNARLTQVAASLGYGYLDLFTPLMAGETVDPRYVGPAAGGDHHLDYHATRAVVIERLWPRLLSVDPVRGGAL